MNLEQKLQITNAVKQYLTTHNISQNELSQKSKVNVSYISAILNGKFTTNAGDGKEVEISDKWLNKLAEHVGFSMQKSYWEVVATSQMLLMLATLQDAKEHGYTNTIIGETGSGKTYILNLFAKQHPTEVFVVTVGSNDTLNDLLDKILDTIGLKVAKTKSKKIRDIAAFMRRMNHEGRKPMLVFDEGEYMKQLTLCMIKELYDGINGHGSMVLIGTDQLLNKMDKMRKKNRDGIPQFYRRIKFGIRKLPSIDRSFKQFLNGYDSNLKRFLQANCDNFGELHDALVPAIREAERIGEPLTESLLKKVLHLTDY